jgi:predicted RNA-binding Zn ribbon-like protein
MTRHKTAPLSLDQLRIVADRPSLNFINTLDPRTGGAALDYLRTYVDLALWGAHTRIVTRDKAARLIRAGRRDAARARTAFLHARELREAMYRIFAGLTRHERPAASDLAVLRTAFHEAIGQARLEPHGDSFQWRLREDVDFIRDSVALDGVALLRSDLLHRVRLCPGSGNCGWVFLDTSKNASRRWCSMAGCGNRAKAQRHFRKIRSQAIRQRRGRVHSKRPGPLR